MNNDKISEKINIHSLPTLRHKIFWTFDHLESNMKDRFGPSEISNFLIEEKGIKTSAQVVWNMLNKEKGMFHKKNKKYKMMEKGRQELMKTTKNGKVIIIEANKPFEAKNVTLSGMFKGLQGEVSICDPYFDKKTLDFIFLNFNKKNTIRVLTQKIIDKPEGLLGRQLKHLSDEGFKVEVRIYGSSELHDRYLIDKNSFWLSGNSFNNLGAKESFLILLGDDIKQIMEDTFNHRWKKSKIFYK